MEDKRTLFSIPQTTIDWLLDSRSPSIRYFTHNNILNKAPDDPVVLSTQAQIADADYTQAIIHQQDADGYWYNRKHYYGPKYRSSHWAMLLLTELGVPPEMDALQKGADFMLRRMAEGKGIYYSIDSYQNSDQSGFCCYWGNWLRYQIYAGNISHPLVQQVIRIVSTDIMRKSKCEYNCNMPCAWGVIRSLFGLALIPEGSRSEKVKNAINAGTAFILNEFELTRADYPNPGKVHPLWFKLSFPLYYQADIPFTLRVLAELQALDHPGAAKALDWLVEKQNKNGRWRGGSPYKSRSHPFLTEPDTPSHWVSMHALSVMTAANTSS